MGWFQSAAGQWVKRPDPPAWQPGQPPPPDMPAESADRTHAGAPHAPVRLTLADQRALIQAGRWGLLRWQSGKRFCFVGTFSMDVSDMAQLVKAAGGQVPAAKLDLSDVDALVVGEGANPDMVAQAWDQVIDVFTEAAFVGELLPSVAQLEAKAGLARYPSQASTPAQVELPF